MFSIFAVFSFVWRLVDCFHYQTIRFVVLKWFTIIALLALMLFDGLTLFYACTFGSIDAVTIIRRRGYNIAARQRLAALSSRNGRHCSQVVAMDFKHCARCPHYSSYQFLTMYINHSIVAL